MSPIGKKECQAALEKQQKQRNSLLPHLDSHSYYPHEAAGNTL